MKNRINILQKGYRFILVGAFSTTLASGITDSATSITLTDASQFPTSGTNFIQIGDDNVMDYSACRVSGNSCIAPPTCQGDGYCPEVAMSSYIIIYE